MRPYWKGDQDAGYFYKIDKIKPAYDATYQSVMFLCKLLLVVDILITTMSVIGRYVPFIPDPAWSEEVVFNLYVLYGGAFGCPRNPERRPHPHDGFRLVSAEKCRKIFRFTL